ncbi:putative histidine kinase HHK1p [Xylaria bambusicola]|uniref:putative histidine kinase HHK1p n=1 Tax=Xylaria bambusicola TaxID=326684 RepID=UPI0020074BEF|nr:putative histidine kinase HHK1p [Xylaria bambusicola]KAI0506631.1 putative histidine kinase HHK1p [Xylaria bambusicola]
MDGSAAPLDEQLDPPARIFERLRQLAGYSWDEANKPVHSTYDNWHFFGTRFVPHSTTSSTSAQTLSNSSTFPKISPSRAGTLTLESQLSSGPRSDGSNDRINSTSPSTTSVVSPTDATLNLDGQPVVARVSYHVLREERAFHTAKTLIATADPDGVHNAKPIDLVRLSPQPSDRGPIIVAIYEHLGPNYLFRSLDHGPAFYYAKKYDDRLEAYRRDDFKLDPPISLMYFLDFAIGATECLELLHHRLGMVHGEIRGDAFHYNMHTNQVKLVSFGSGVRSFEHGLTSTGWSMLSKELGAKNKLVYISPEQTGRMPAEPDTRTDIYSLGVLFWMLLTQQPAFTGVTPLDIVQCVLGRRIPMVSNLRTDVPEAISRIIQKCTSKHIPDRYNSASGLRYDLRSVQKLLELGDQEALKNWTVASKDVSSYFMLPTAMVGRDQEKAVIVNVIERVSRSQALGKKYNTSHFSDVSGRASDILDTIDGSSDGEVSVDVGHGPNNSFTQTNSSAAKHMLDEAQQSVNGTDTHAVSEGTISSNNSARSIISGNQSSKTWERHPSVSVEAKSGTDNASDRPASVKQTTSASSEASTRLSKQIGTVKYRRRGHCEIVTIEGAGGLGKSFLVQQVLVEARRRGYCATAKFDTARRTAFAPLLKLVSSLFRQVWGERNTDTSLHTSLRDYVRPLWPSLHQILGLPEFLFGPPDPNVTRPPSSAPSSASSRNSLYPLRRRGSSGSSPASSLPRSPHAPSQSSHDYVRAGASTKTIRFMNTFLDILRIFAAHHFMCLCLDDLQFADDESMELITQVIAARLKMLLIITYRPDEIDPEKVHKILHPVASEENPKSNGSKITRVVLKPLTEDEVGRYVGYTLCCPPEDVAPLALIIQSRTAGNPFYIREMLNACYRQRCIWYGYRESRWLYDLDRLFEEFKGEHGHNVLDNDFITRRLNELPPASRWIMAWAALLGNSFSFDLICQLMSGEYGLVDDELNGTEDINHRTVFSKAEVVAGLQAAVNSCIIVQGDTDDRFRFAHDRYVQAAASLKECNIRSMHFIIAQTLMAQFSSGIKTRDDTAAHVCECVDMIKGRVHNRYPFRKLLMECAATAIENGAKPTAVKYYRRAILLLQPDPWTEGKDDVHYDETLQLYLRAAECYVYMGNHEAAQELTDTVYDNATTMDDKAAAAVLHSRIQFQTGNAIAALATLKQSLHQSGVEFDHKPTWEKCDETFMALSEKLKVLGHAEAVNPSHEAKAQKMTSGLLLADAAQAAWWSDALEFYNLALALMNMHLTDGPMPQSSMAFLYLAMIALSRFNMLDFASELGSQCSTLLNAYRDPTSIARGYMAYATFISHINTPLCISVAFCEQSLDCAASAGDRASVILSFGLSVQMKFFASDNVADLESVCQYCCEEVPGWHQDTSGGTFLISVRQVCRSLQGKTNTMDPKGVMSDDQHDSIAYKAWLDGYVNNGGRSTLFYETLEIIPLYLYGHYEEACTLGRRCESKLDLIWSARNTRVVLFFYGLAHAGLVLQKLADPRTNKADMGHEIQEAIDQIKGFSQKVKDWQQISNVNYLAWSKFLDAQVAELSGEHGSAIRLHEAGLDHASEYGLTFEEALGNYLMAGFFIRQSARRSATAVLKEAISLWKQLGANGIAHAIEEDHILLLHGPTPNPRLTEAAVQTDFAGDSASVTYTADGEDVRQAGQPAIEETKETRMAAWRGSTTQTEPGVGLPALDMIDLHAILVSSQVISSVLRVDVLLKTMCDVILQTCGASVTQAAIIVPDEDNKADSNWCIASSGDPEKGATAHVPRLPLIGTSLVAENVILYCTRFREVVFISDLLTDERFGNVAESWLQRNPMSKAVVAIPICHGSKPLLGVLYLEGESGSFTDRIITVLQLLVNQIGISYSNALAMKELEKAFKENDAMIDLQKRALAQARAAEAKAKDAENEAKRNVKIAEEAAKAKNIFLANVSHELRTPLNGVIGNSELLRDSNLNKEQLEMAESIRVSADLLLTVINDILDFSKMEADKMKLYIIAFNPEEMVREVVRAVSYSNREKTSKKNVKIVQDIDLPSMLIYGDPIRLHQVLGNLIGNSLKFTEDGSITIGAKVEHDWPEKVELTFWVRDTGIGIPPKQLAKLFKPFSQADASTARKYGGSGLGLSICKSLIETMMHGEIKLESQENTGTTVLFTVTFEKAKPEVSAGDVQNIQLPPTTEQPRNRIQQIIKDDSEFSYIDLTMIPKEQLRICIAEDNQINQKIAIQYVRRLGYTHVDAYENGLKAVEGLRRKAREGKPYHIVLMDVQMPVLDGYEATKLLRQDPNEDVRTILVIAMTASAIQGDREKCLAAGMNDYLAKPVKVDLLRRKLDTYTVAQILDSNKAGETSSSSSPTPSASPVGKS